MKGRPEDGMIWPVDESFPTHYFRLSLKPHSCHYI